MFIFTKVKVAVPRAPRERWFSLDTDNLAPLEKHRLELLVDSRGINGEVFRSIRGYFQQSEEAISLDRLNNRSGGMMGFSVDLHRYWEDVEGRKLTEQQALGIVTQNDNLEIFPPGARPHDITLALTDKAVERMRQTVERLGLDLWKSAGSPPNELPQFVEEARRQLSAL